ncbi:MAG: HAMP domain-containing histidine kinase, partial [Candidatus Marithrix sp.]|nr:HAMP domain-containing histidine kinase [Candidatus Marithrix sp.]
MNIKSPDKINLEQFATDKYWLQVVTLLHDILKPERLIILDCKLGLNYAKEIGALNCSLQDINKQFYQQDSVQEIIKSNFLQPVNTDEEQSLIPLFFDKKLQGILLLAIKKMQLNNEATTKNFTNQIAEALYHRHQFLESSEIELGKTALKRRLSMLENIMDDSDTATILYDVFGMAVQVNQSMRALAQIFGLKPQTTSALDFFTAVGKTDTKTVKQHFCDMFLKQNKIVQKIKLSGVIERYFILNMQVFHYFDKDLNEDMQQGILCQLVDITKMKLQSTLKEQIAEQLIFQFRNDMQSILTASQLLTDNQIVEAEKNTAAKILQNKINNYMQTLAQAEKQLNIKIDEDPTKVTTYPINAKAPILDAMENISEEATKQQVKLTVNLPDLVSLIFASQAELCWVIGSIFALLIEDAIAKTNIIIDVEERDHWVTYTFKNTGFGIPNERFQQYLFMKKLEVTDKFHDIRRAINIVRIWDGKLIAESQVGVGI